MTFYCKVCSILAQERGWLRFVLGEYRRIFFKKYFCIFYKFACRGHKSLTVCYGEIGASLIPLFQISNPLGNDLKQNIAKYVIEIVK